MKSIFIAPVAITFFLATCGTPPEYTLNEEKSGVPVSVNGQSCRADLYDVKYSRLFKLNTPESVITRDDGTQFRIECGATTTACKLDQSLEACVADIESSGRPNRPESSGSSGYSPPGG